MTCAKATVVCTVIAPDGQRWVGTNGCANPQAVCPRAPSEGYDKCRSVCGQFGHAEQVAATAASRAAAGGVAYVEGHTYACDNCLAALRAIGVERVVIGTPPTP